MRIIKIAAAALVIMALTSCAPLNIGIIQTNLGSKDDIVFTPELKSMLKANPHPKIVIRVMNPPTAVTEADKVRAADRLNAYISEIETLFVKAGYTVRDRALLENLMKTGNADYKSIKDKIDTDLMIDIMDLNFDKTIRANKFFNTTTQREESFATDETYVNVGVATLSCRVTIVDQARLGGVFTLQFSPSDSGWGTLAKFYVDASRRKLSWVSNENKYGMFPYLELTINTDEEKQLFTKLLATRLIKILSSQ